MNNNVRKHGGLIIHILVAIYMFVGLAIVCDDYFVPALDRIAEGMYGPQLFRGCVINCTVVGQKI